MQLPDAYKLIYHENKSILFEAILFKAKHSRTIFWGPELTAVNPILIKYLLRELNFYWDNSVWIN